MPTGEKKTFARKNYFCQDGFSMKKTSFSTKWQKNANLECRHRHTTVQQSRSMTPTHVITLRKSVLKLLLRNDQIIRAYFNVPTGTDVLGDLKSVLEGLVTRA